MWRSTGILVLALLGLGGCAAEPAAYAPGDAAPSPTDAPVAAPPSPPATTTVPGPSAGTLPSPNATPSPDATPAPDAAHTTPATAATHAPCPQTGAITTVAWTEAEGGRSLAVTPASPLRACAGPLTRWDGIPPGWREVLDLAGTEADSPAMEQQYACHLRFARAKETWNLEPWRPEVDEDELMLARCNP